MAFRSSSGPGVEIIAGSRTDLPTALRQTMLYADVFNYPLTAPEVHRFLINVSAALPTVAAALQAESDGDLIERSGPWYFLRGRREVVEMRERRAQVAAWKWRQARRYGAHIAALPFVRFVGVTGSLAMDNAEAHEDIDYFIVTAPGRLWLTRGLVVLLTRLAAAGGVELCPNYLVTGTNLELRQQDLFSAHELAQMAPLAGATIYQRFLERNPWAARRLPNAFPHPAAASIAHPGRVLRWAEGLLGTTVGSRIEDWERERKVRKLLQRAAREGGAVAFTPHECKGHFGDRNRQVAVAYRERLDRFGVAAPDRLQPDLGIPERGWPRRSTAAPQPGLSGGSEVTRV